MTLHNQAKRHSATLKTQTQEDGYFEFTSVPLGGYLVVAEPSHGGSPIKDSFGTGDRGIRLIMHEWTMSFEDWRQGRDTVFERAMALANRN